MVWSNYVVCEIFPYRKPGEILDSKIHKARYAVNKPGAIRTNAHTKLQALRRL